MDLYISMLHHRPGIKIHSEAYGNKIINYSENIFTQSKKTQKSSSVLHNLPHEIDFP